MFRIYIYRDPVEGAEKEASEENIEAFVQPPRFRLTDQPDKKYFSEVLIKKNNNTAGRKKDLLQRLLPVPSLHQMAPLHMDALAVVLVLVCHLVIDFQQINAFPN